MRLRFGHLRKLAGVSKTTVSLCLRDHPRIRPEVRLRIQRLAAEAGYRPNALVANLFAHLRSSKTSTLPEHPGPCSAWRKDLSELETVPTFRSWIAGCRARATEQGYGFDQLWIYEPGISPARLVTILDARNIRGLAVVGFYEGEAIPREFDPIWHRSAAVAIGTRPGLAGDPFRFQRPIRHGVPRRAGGRPARVSAVGSLSGQSHRQHRGKQVYRRFPRRPGTALARARRAGVRSPAGSEETFSALAGASQAGGHSDDPRGGQGMGASLGLAVPGDIGLVHWTNRTRPATGPGCSRTANSSAARPSTW